MNKYPKTMLTAYDENKKLEVPSFFGVRSSASERNPANNYAVSGPSHPFIFNQAKELVNRLVELGVSKWKIKKEIGLSWHTIHNYHQGVHDALPENILKLRLLLCRESYERQFEFDFMNPNPMEVFLERWR